MKEAPRDGRPPVAIGHIVHPVNEVRPATLCLIELGMRSIVERDDFSVLELRGGTHVIVRKAESPIEAGTPASFDLIVDDISETHARYSELGLAPSPIQPGRIHSSFTVTDPSGYRITINSTHASDQPI
jgi:hypothetical protein